MFFVMCVVIYGNKNNLCTVLFSISDWSSPLCCLSFMMSFVLFCLDDQNAVKSRYVWSIVCSLNPVLFYS